MKKAEPVVIIIPSRLGSSRLPGKPLAKIGDACKVFGWNDPPLTSFRLNNMLTGAYYPFEKTREIAGKLPFSLQEGVQKTLYWMEQEGMLRSRKA